MARGRGPRGLGRGPDRPRARRAPDMRVSRRDGRPCPSCGMTRSWNAMGHGELRRAAGFHPLGPATFVAAAAIALGGDDRAARLLTPDPRLRPAFGALAAAWASA